MKRLILASIIAAACPAYALKPADVQIKTDSAIKVQVTPRAGNTSKTILITVNKQDRVTQCDDSAMPKCVQVYPAAPPPPPPPPLPPQPPAACAPSALTWQVGTSSCTAPYAGGASGTTAALLDSTVPDTGTAAATCTNGAVTLSAVACSPQPEMHAGIHVDPSTVPDRMSAGFAWPWLRLATTQPTTGDSTGDFRTLCDPSHMSFDDPIVYPGQPGKAHLHVFFGNTETNAASTAASIAGSGNSTCMGGTLNRTAYWMPATVDVAKGNRVVRPRILLVYYKRDGKLDVKPLPPGLRMISGDPTASGPKADIFFAQFSCGGTGPATFTIPKCAPGSDLWEHVVFPHCWNGKDLDSPDHRSHMSFGVIGGVPSMPNGCPATHPVVVPQISLTAIYTLAADDDSSGWRLASDTYSQSIPGGYSLHADWFNGWDPATMDAWVNNCIRKGLNCDVNLLGDGREMGRCSTTVTGCTQPPPVVTAGGRTFVAPEEAFLFLDVARTYYFGPNGPLPAGFKPPDGMRVAGDFIAVDGHPGSNYCNTNFFGRPPAGAGPRGCYIDTPNPFAP